MNKAKSITLDPWRVRVAAVTREELKHPEVWHYVSFADTVFRGVVIIKAHGVTDAVSKCNRLNINPGGEVLCVPMPDKMVAQVPIEDRNRLLFREDVQRIWLDAKSVRQHEAERRTQH